MHSISALALISAALSSLAPSAAAQAWTAGPAVPTSSGAARTGATLVDAPAGMFLLGGLPANVDGDAPVEQWNGAAWVTTTPLESVFLNGAAVVDELGRVLVIAGADTSGDMGDSYEWNVADGNAGGIDDRSNQAPAQGFAVATDDLGRVYSLGGSSVASFEIADVQGRVERYDATANSWTVLASMPTPVADASACNDGQGHLLVFGGYDANGARTANVARYDLMSGTWSDTDVSDMPAALAGGRAVLGNDGLVYVLGGSDASGPVATVYVFDPATGTWSGGPAMLEPREHFGCAIDAAGFIWAVGGTTSNTSEKMFTSTCPTVVGAPGEVPAYVGMVATMKLAIAGSPPFTYQWRVDGVPFVDGPTGNGSEVSGAQTGSLTFRRIAAADGAHVYDCVVSNACGSTTSPAATLALTQPPAFPLAFHVESLHPAGSLGSSATSVDGTVIVGTTSYSDPTWGTLSRPGMWNDLGAGGFVDLTPIGSAGGSCSKVRNGAIVGWWWWPYTVPQYGTGYDRHASLWTTAGTHYEMQPSSQEFGSIADTDGLHHAGGTTFDESSTVSHGRVWTGTSRSAVSLTPPIAWGSSASVVDGDSQFGSVNLGFGVVHAAMWSGSSSTFVDLQPSVTGAGRSYVYDAENGTQIGAVYFGNVPQPCMWAGAPESYTELNLPGSSITVRSMRYGMLLGTISDGGLVRPALFRHGVSEWVDLQQFVPPWYGTATVRDIYVDETTGQMTLVGSALNLNTSISEALVWRSATVAAAATRLGKPCPVTLEFTPDGQGGYVVARTSPIWFDDSVVGVELAAGGLLQEDAMTPAQALGFSFVMPGGGLTSEVFVDDNGRVVADAAATSSNASSPSAMRLGPAVIAPLWTDLSSANGSVRFHSEATSGFATITWRDVPQAGLSNGYTFQLRLRDDGSFAITYAQIANWGSLVHASSDNVVIGCSGGGGAVDPGAVDFSVYPIVNAGEPMVYQSWLATNAPAHPELQSHLHLAQFATVGGSLEVELAGLTSHTLGAFLIVGFVDPAVDVTPLLTGMPGLTGCELRASLDALLPMAPSAAGAAASLAIPADPGVIGAELFVQGLGFAPGESLLSLVPSDALRVIVGD